MFMKEFDSIHALLREEWKSPEPTAELDRRVTEAYRSAVRPKPAWQQFWTMRVSVPAPVLFIAAVAIVALVIWLRPAASPAPTERSGVVTELNVSGFQPLPNGEARVVPAVEIKK
jgi:hypothetical protein